MLVHGLAGAEAAGDRRCAALGDRKQRVHDALTGDQRNGRRQTLLHRTGGTDRPLLTERQLMAVAEVVLQHCDHVMQTVFAVGLDLFDNARQVGTEQNAVLNDRGLGQCGVDLSALQTVARLDLERDRPQPLRIERRDRRAAADKRACLLLDLLERTLDAVKDIVENAGSEQHVHRCAGAGDRVAGLQTGRLLIHLDRRQPVGDADDLAHEVLRADVHHFHHLKAVGVFDGDNGTVDPVYYIIVHSHSSLSVQKVQSTDRAAFSINHSRCASSLASNVSSAMMPISAQ